MSFVSKTEDRVIIDVRTKTEWDEGHHPEAIHLPHEHISEYKGDKDKSIILYCTTGRRANIAKQKLGAIEIPVLCATQDPALVGSDKEQACACHFPHDTF